VRSCVLACLLARRPCYCAHRPRMVSPPLRQPNFAGRNKPSVVSAVGPARPQEMSSGNSKPQQVGQGGLRASRSQQQPNWVPTLVWNHYRTSSQPQTPPPDPRTHRSRAPPHVSTPARALANRCKHLARRRGSGRDPATTSSATVARRGNVWPPAIRSRSPPCLPCRTSPPPLQAASRALHGTNEGVQHGETIQTKKKCRRF